MAIQHYPPKQYLPLEVNTVRHVYYGTNYTLISYIVGVVEIVSGQRTLAFLRGEEADELVSLADKIVSLKYPHGGFDNAKDLLDFYLCGYNDHND